MIDVMKRAREIQKRIVLDLQKTGMSTYLDGMPTNEGQQENRAILILNEVLKTNADKGRAIYQARFTIQAFLTTSDYDDVAEACDNLINALSSSWDDGIDFVLSKEIERITPHVGAFSGQSIVLIDLNVNFYNRRL